MERKRKRERDQKSVKGCKYLILLYHYQQAFNILVRSRTEKAISVCV